MADYELVAERLLRAASNVASNATDEENTFQSLVSRTRRNFRPSVPSPRGRRRKASFSRKVFVLKLANSEFLPAATEQKYLKRRGLGEADQQVTINRSSSLEEIKENILRLYSNQIQSLLRMSGFRLARCDRIKKLHFLLNLTNASDLEKELGASKIILVPNNDFPCDLPLLAETIVAETNEAGATPVTRSVRPAATTTIPLNNRSSQEEMLEDFQVDEIIATSEVTNEFCISMPTLPEEAEILSIEITRSDCVREMFSLYAEKTVVDKKLNVTFRGEMGVDGGGLTKELFNIFFNEIENTYFRGEDCLIPYLQLNKMHQKGDFEIIGRILEHMLLLTGTIPSKMSKITLMLVADGEKNISDEILLQEFLSYVNPCLRHITKKGIQGFDNLSSKEVEILQDFFQSCKFFELPASEKFKKQLCLIATEELIETPRRLIDVLRKGISLDKYEFWSKCDFGVLLDLQKPTPYKVANCIVTEENLSNEDSRILHYLDMYIRCLSNENVSLFVFMVTGSFMMPLQINVKFNDLVGLAQRPTFSTCTDTLYLPRSYSTYQELKNDLNVCLHSEESKIYSTY